MSRWAFQGQVQASNVWELYTLSPLKLKTTVGRLSKATNWLEWDLNLGLPGSSLSSCLASGLRDPREIMMWPEACGWVPWASDFASEPNFAHL